MAQRSIGRITVTLALMGALAACSGSGEGRNGLKVRPAALGDTPVNAPADFRNGIETNPDNTIWSIFNRKSNDTKVSVNKYLWTASLEVLNFLPVQSVDPFTGVIVTGFGIPPGGGRSYRATVLIDDPALDARSLNVSLQTRGGRAVSKATSRAVEDAILSRAREMRIADGKF